MLIGIVGTKRSGKDTVARIIQAYDIYQHYFKELKLVDENTFIKNCLSDKYFQELDNKNYHSKYVRHAFADNLKLCISIITGINYYDLLTDEEVKNSMSDFGNGMTYRKLLQQLGSEVCRTIDPDIWIKSLFKDYTDELDWIIPDVRYENEANFLVKKGGILIRMHRANPTNEHSSETGLLNYPSISEDIYNTGSMDELIEKVKNIIIKYKLV